MKDCPACGSVERPSLRNDLLLQCRCGFAIGADDLHNVYENWDRRARQKTEEMGTDIRWRPNMSEEERADLAGLYPKDFRKLPPLAPEGEA